MTFPLSSFQTSSTTSHLPHALFFPPSLLQCYFPPHPLSHSSPLPLTFHSPNRTSALTLLLLLLPLPSTPPSSLPSRCWPGEQLTKSKSWGPWFWPRLQHQLCHPPLPPSSPPPNLIPPLASGPGSSLSGPSSDLAASPGLRSSSAWVPVVPCSQPLLLILELKSSPSLSPSVPLSIASPSLLILLLFF